MNGSDRCQCTNSLSDILIFLCCRPWILRQSLVPPANGASSTTQVIHPRDRRSVDIVALVELVLGEMSTSVRDAAKLFGIPSHMRLRFCKENKKEKKNKSTKKRIKKKKEALDELKAVMTVVTLCDGTVT